MDIGTSEYMYSDTGSLIERKDAIELVALCGTKPIEPWTFDELQEDIQNLPSAEKQGEWKNYKDEHYCSYCGEVVISDWYTEDEWYDFCPNCGAKMKGADDDI